MLTPKKQKNQFLISNFGQNQCQKTIKPVTDFEIKKIKQRKQEFKKIANANLPIFGA